MGFNESLLTSELGTWIFVGSLFPSIFFFVVALVSSVVYFVATNHCPTRVTAYLFTTIGLAHLYVLLYAFLLFGPIFSSLSQPLALIFAYTVLAVAAVAGGVYLNFFDETLTSECTKSTIFASTRALSTVFALFIFALVVLSVVIGCARCCGHLWCRCCTSRGSEFYAHLYDEGGEDAEEAYVGDFSGARRDRRSAAPAPASKLEPAPAPHTHSQPAETAHEGPRWRGGAPGGAVEMSKLPPVHQRGGW